VLERTGSPVPVLRRAFLSDGLRFEANGLLHVRIC